MLTLTDSEDPDEMPHNVQFNNLLYTSESLMLTLTSREDPDEMPHNVAFHQGLHYLLRGKKIFTERNTV